MTESQPKISLNADSLKEWSKRGLEHKRYEYDLRIGDTVIDLGAYKGEWAEKIYEKYGCKIIVVEPTEYIRGFQYGTVINKAAGTHAGKLSFGGRAYCTSVMEPGDHEYECIDINEVIKGAGNIAVLKINIEGSEYDILMHIISAGLHKNIKNIQVQFHEIAGIPYEYWYKEIEKKLSLTHERTWYYPFCWENWKLK
jgi:FkbM family methyltransferase